ncbi:GPI-anchored adhesin-like protein precursor [Actinidia chinensis var. chinensis]|uniref:GPI-anchored adhesin-like protein n=1 Tax=Actinidia chinensis var. chinensis TaxID=1590841 RepID=A0A2R6QJZ6_ACTCC|nr:GPI-anchored adhesin-like protein precursor [Actinidia chinensis var. chinensis]
MDYDENDFQGQNLQLAGEESSKFSPVLHPYALPKFDFDDGLQGHLRFDSLVENEVFLGIPSQEDNQWIEDFSRGSSGIEFRSSAAESCSIARRNNVWSEATSSESVEMLLKSVRQEEMVPGETIIEESDACDELRNLTEQMEHHLKQDDKAKDVMDSEPALPSDERTEHFSNLNDVEGTSKTQEVEKSIHGSSYELDPNVSSGTRGVIVTESMPGVDRECDDVNQTEARISVNESHDNKMQNDSFGSGMQIDDMNSSSKEASVQVLDTTQPEHQLSDNSFENANCLRMDTGKAPAEHQVFSKEADVDDKTLKGIAAKTDTHNLENLPRSYSEAESTEQHAVESGISNFAEPSSLVLKGAGDPQIAETCSEDLRSRDIEKASKCEPVDLANSIEVPQQFRENIHVDLPVVFEDDSKLEGHALEISNVKTEIPTSSDNGQAVESSRNYGEELSSLTLACSSTELLGEKHAVQDLKRLDDASVDHKKDSNAGVDVSPPTVAGSMQIFEGNLVSNPNDVHHDQDVSRKEKENAKLPNDSTSTDCEVVESLSSGKRVEPLSQGEDMQGNNEEVHELECATTARNESALNVGIEKTNLALHDTVDGLPLLSKSGVTIGKGTDHLDETKKTEDEGPKEANVLALKESSQGARELRPLLELEKDAPHTSACKLSHEDVDQSLTLEICNSASGTEHGLSMDMTFNTASGSEQIAKATKTCQNSSNSSSKLETCHTLCDSAVIEGDSSERQLVPGNHEEAPVEKIHEVASVKVTGEGVSADSVKLDSGIPTVGCIVLSQREKEKEGVKEPMGEGFPVSVVSFQTSQNVSRDNAAKDERSFTSEAHSSAGPLERETSKDVQSRIQPMVVEGSPSTSSVGQMDPKKVLELSHRSSQAPDGEIARGGSKATPERKTRRASRSAGKESVKRGKHKETTPSRQTERGDRSCSVSASLAGTGQFVQFEGLRPLGKVESSGTIPCGVVSMPTSNLPDLNTSTPPSALFQQPFTDLQQVQLRAQIFVYGSLIQGAAPDEACMVSAYGASDGGRSVWEPVWRACMERIQGQKPHPNKPETPVQPRSGARPPDQSIKRGAHQSKVASSPLGQASSKGTTSPVVNSMIPLSSPLWNISTTPDGLQSNGMQRTGPLDYHQPLAPLRPFQTPSTRGFVGHNASWLSQTPFPGQWVASPQTSAFDANARFSLLPMTETVKLTPVKESSAPVSSGTKLASPSKLVHSKGPSLVAENSSLSGMKEISVLPGQNSIDLKPRKRKKVTASEDLGRNSLLAQTRTKSVSAPVVTSHLSSSVIVSTPAFFASKTDASKSITAVSPMLSTDHLKRGEQKGEPKLIISEETSSKVEEAKRQAEDAEALAAAAVSHSQSVWSQLDKQKNSGLTPDAETKLASAAVAVAAAASVAKAAAAAAKIASNAALQAKLMADEVLISSRTGNPSLTNASSLPDVNNLGKTTAASILMGGNRGNCSSSVIVAAREAARRRVEAASAASKQAENLDAILKAAELAAEAVSQAGKIVAMGDPLPLNELIEAGPEGYWRVPQMPPKQGVIPNSDNRERSKVDIIEDGVNVPGSHSKDGPSEEAKRKNRGFSPLAREDSKESKEDHLRAVDGISSSFTTGETDARGKRSRRASDLAKTIGVVPESEIGSRSASITAQDDYQKVVGIVKDNSIKEGCLVEVRKDSHDFKTAWFSANVLSLKDGKAFVCYTELQSDEGRKPDEPRFLPLSANEKIFNVGKSTGDQNKPNALRTMRTGLQKEGSRVIFGVPKPGKKRKFMEVSKHYVAEKSSKTNESNDSVKFAKYLMPQGRPGSRGWNNTKIVPKEKQAAESRTRALRSGKSQGVSGRTFPQNDRVLASALSAQNDGTAIDHMIKGSVSTEENVSGQQDLMEFGSVSNTEGIAEGPVSFSSRALPSNASLKKTSTSNAKSERVDGGKLAPSSRKLAKAEVKDNLTSGDLGSKLDVAERRRSNRRIQPTSRLLEGLQSSLIISKIPVVPHDRSHRSQNRGTSKGKNHG